MTETKGQAGNLRQHWREELGSQYPIWSCFLPWLGKRVSSIRVVLPDSRVVQAVSDYLQGKPRQKEFRYWRSFRCRHVVVSWPLTEMEEKLRQEEDDSADYYNREERVWGKFLLEECLSTPFDRSTVTNFILRAPSSTMQICGNRLRHHLLEGKAWYQCKSSHTQDSYWGQNLTY